MKNFERMKKLLAFVLAMAMVVQYMPSVAMAEDGCSHHSHDGSCGYVEAVAGKPCGHVCGVECTQTVTACVHDHTLSGCPYTPAVEAADCDHVCSEDAGCVAAQAEVLCTCGAVPQHDAECASVLTEGAECSCTPTLTHGEGCAPKAAVSAVCAHTTHEGCAYREAAAERWDCTHTCSADSGCVTTVTVCTHTTHEGCGYVKSVTGSPCTFDPATCAQCAAEAEPEKVCTCDTDDTTHATFCDLYIRPENPTCSCEIPCSEENLNYWCAVCGVEGKASCTGAGESGAYLDEALPKITLSLDKSVYKSTSGTPTDWFIANFTLTYADLIGGEFVCYIDGNKIDRTWTNHSGQTFDSTINLKNVLGTYYGRHTMYMEYIPGDSTKSNAVTNTVEFFYGTAVYVIVNPSTGGTVTPSVPNAVVGEVVTLTATPDDGYELESLTATYGDNQMLTITDGKITMPSYDEVHVTAVFKQKEASTYTVSVDSAIDDTVTVSPASAGAGETITVTVTPNTGYVVSSVSYLEAGTTEPKVIAKKNGVYSFNMPAANVTVSAAFAQDYGIYIKDRSVTSENAADIFGDGKASYDPATNTLTLNDITVERSDGTAITATGDLVIAGSGAIIGSANGIYSKNGSITVSGNFSEISGSEGKGIVAAGDIMITGNVTKISGTTGIHAQNSNDVTISGSIDQIEATKENNSAIVANSVTIDSDATVKANDHIGATIDNNGTLYLPENHSKSKLTGGIVYIGEKGYQWNKTDNAYRCLDDAHEADPDTARCKYCGIDMAVAVAVVIDSANVSTSYADLAAAMTAAQGKDSATVKLMQNVTGLTQTIDVTSGNITLDLNGKSITSTANYSLNISGGTHSISGGSINGNLHIYGTAQVTLSATVESGQNYTVMVDGNGKLTVTGGTLRNTSSNGAAVAAASNGKLEILGGNLEGSHFGVHAAGTSKVTIGGNGSISGATAGLYVDKDAEVTVQGGSITSTNGKAIWNDANGTTNITGGRITGSVSVRKTATATVALSGGTFVDGITVENTTLNDILAEGYVYYQGGTALALSETLGKTKLENNGDVTVTDIFTQHDVSWLDSDGNAIGGGSFKDAIDAANSNSSVASIRLNKDVTISESRTLTPASGNITIDWNGKNFTAGNTLHLYGKATLIDSNTANPGTVKATGSGQYGLSILGTAEIKGGNYVASNNVSVVAVNHTTAVCTISGGSFSGSRTVITNEGTLTVTNGSFTSGSVSVISTANGSKTIISGGSYSGSKAAIMYDGGTLEATTVPNGFAITGGNATAVDVKDVVTAPKGYCLMTDGAEATQIEKDKIYTFGLASYTISCEDVTGGTVTADVQSAKMNEKVTLTIKPGSGCELESVSYTPAGGTEITITADSNGTYSFTMPANNVTVKAVFTPEIFDLPVYYVDITSGTPVSTLILIEDITGATTVAEIKQLVYAKNPDLPVANQVMLDKNGLMEDDKPLSEFSLMVNPIGGTDAEEGIMLVLAYDVTVVANAEHCEVTDTTWGSLGKVPGGLAQTSFKVEPKTGYHVKSVTIWDAAENKVAFEEKDGTYSFAMPAANVKITVTCTLEAEYPLWVQGIRVNSINADDILGDGKVSYDPSTLTLTLNNATISTTDGGVAAIQSNYSDYTLKIVGTGTNTISAAGGSGIYVKNGNVKLSGGTFIISGSTNGIFVENGSLSVDGAQVEATGANKGAHATANPVVTSGGLLSVTGTEGVVWGSCTIGSRTFSKLTVAENAGLTVSSGETATVTDRIDSSGEIQVEGTLKIPAGSGYTTISGGILYVGAKGYQWDETAKAYRCLDNQHDWVYSKKDNAITADCSCGASGGSVSIFAPALTVYGGPDSANATLSSETLGGLQNLSSQILYQEGTDVLTAAPTEAGTYKASLTVDGKTISVEYTIAKATVTGVQAPTAKNLTYNGEDQPLVAPAGAENRVVYYKLGENGTWSTDIPKACDAETYSVYWKVVGDDNHSDFIGEAVAATISPKSITVSGITAADKVYDGNTEAVLVCTDAVFSGKVEGDELTVTGLGTFVTKNAGTGRAVNISSLTLGGADKGNYTLAASGQQTQTTASIAPKDITVTITPNGGTFGETITGAQAQLNGLIDPDAPVVTLIYTAQGYDSQAVPVNAGTYTVTATIIDANYTLTGTTAAEFVVNKAVVTPPTVEDKVYTGAQQKANVTDTQQYTVSENLGGINVGEYQVKLTLKSANYKWADSDEAVKVLTYRITEIELQASEATLSADLTYNGEAQEPTIVVTNGSATLSADIHYTVSYEKIGADSTATAISGKPVDAGAYNAVITGKDNFGGTVKLPFEIDPCTAITVTPDTLQDATYTGSAITPAVTVKGVQNAVLVKDQDYTVAYSSNINAGTATVTISGIGNYDGAEVTRTFKIDPKTLTSENVTVDPVVVTYVANQTTVPTITVKDGTKTLVAGTDYVIAYKDSSGSPVAAPNAVGSYTAEIVGIADVSEDGSGNYAGLITKTFYISDVNAKIAAMPDPAKTLPDNAAAIATYDAALAAYNALPQELRDSHVGTENKTKLDAMGKALTAYDIVSRTGTWYVRGSGKTLTFTGNGYYAALDSYTQGAYGKFLRVELDGKTLDPKYYDAKAGSTIITLKSSCLDTLSTGKHSIKLIYTDGSTDGADVFRVYIGNGIPLTGDTTDLVMLSGTAIAAAMCIALLLVFTPWKKGKYLR